MAEGKQSGCCCKVSLAVIPCSNPVAGEGSCSECFSAGLAAGRWQGAELGPQGSTQKPGGSEKNW